MMLMKLKKQFTNQCIVNVGGPHRCEEHEEHVREVVNRKDAHEEEIRRCLQNAIDGVEGDGAPGCQRLSRVVLVVKTVNVFVEELVRVQSLMHPKDIILHKAEVYEEV